MLWAWCNDALVPKLYLTPKLKILLAVQILFCLVWFLCLTAYICGLFNAKANYIEEQKWLGLVISTAVGCLIPNPFLYI